MLCPTCPSSKVRLSGRGLIAVALVVLAVSPLGLPILHGELLFSTAFVLVVMGLSMLVIGVMREAAAWFARKRSARPDLPLSHDAHPQRTDD